MVMYQRTLVTVYTDLSENWVLMLYLLSLKIVSFGHGPFSANGWTGLKGFNKICLWYRNRELFYLSVLHLSTEAFLFWLLLWWGLRLCFVCVFFFQCSLGSSAVEIKGMTNMDTLQTGIPLVLVKWRENFYIAGGTFFKQYFWRI